MYRIELSASEEHALEQTFKTTPDRRLRDRCQAVLMVSRGRKRYQVAQDLGVDRTTVRRWLRRYEVDGLDGLVIEWAPGAPRRIPEELTETLIGWVKTGPTGCGLNRANWTYGELARHLYRETGIEVSETTMREWCQRHQIRPYRPTYRYLRGDPERQAQAKADLAAYKKKRTRATASCSARTKRVLR